MLTKSTILTFFGAVRSYYFPNKAEKYNKRSQRNYFAKFIIYIFTISKYFMKSNILDIENKKVSKNT